ncbi:MAG: 4Fe-4S ferredoxin [Candidatus Eisenbacteria bacterium]|nr:4Fe-4S ferredoxin [Candidatus Eisenbacteria bacterium]
MSASRVREIIHIDEERCDGCGACVPQCAEGAIQVIEGKARLMRENLCDGLGNCLGSCPRDAIRIERREAAAFDEAAVAAHLAALGADGKADRAATAGRTPDDTAPGARARGASLPCGCPGSAMRELRPPRDPSRAAVGPTKGDAVISEPETQMGTAGASELTHWPVQLQLLPAEGTLWEGADLLIAADCVAFAMPDFHARLLRGKTLAVGCPKLDDLGTYVQKLTEVFRSHDMRSVTVAHMEVPCCSGMVGGVVRALRAAASEKTAFSSIRVGVNGCIQEIVQKPNGIGSSTPLSA